MTELCQTLKNRVGVSTHHRKCWLWTRGQKLISFSGKQ